MRRIETITVIIAGDEPEGMFESILEDGADERGYSFEEGEITETIADSFFKLIKS